MYENPYYQARDEWRASTEQNSARSAIAWGTVHSQGWGEVVIEDPIMFGATFVHQPTVTYGFALDDEQQVLDKRLPRCSGGVLSWVQDANDYYVGAHVFVTVSTVDPVEAIQAWLLATQVDPDTEDPQLLAPQVPTDYAIDIAYDITHSFTFQALAIKDITP